MTAQALPKPSITFWTAAPDDAPDEMRGHTCYFHPERLEWRVGAGRVYVIAHGPATRVERRQGLFGWAVEGYHSADERPPWLRLPDQLLNVADLAARRLLEGTPR